MSASYRRRLLGASALIAAAASSATAYAQQAAPAAAPASASVDEVTVTASRVRRDGFQAPTPVTVLSADVLQAQGNRNVTQTLYQLPQIVPQSSGNGGATNIGAQYIDLRNLGQLRTLVLINGRRVAPTNPLGGVDINIVPGSLVENVEVVTGGASAAYGSDAVAGMVNLGLNTKLNGWKGDLQFGQTKYADGRELSGSLAYGTAFAQGKGHVVIAAEVTNNKGMPDCFDRSWCKNNWATVTNPAYAPGNGQYRQIITPDARVSIATFGGLITAGPLRGTQFIQGGTPAPFTYGTAVGSLLMIGGTDAGWSGKQREGVAPVERRSLYSTFGFDFTDNLSLFAEGSYARSHSRYDSSLHYDAGTLVIRRDNAFLPQSVRDRMVAANITTFNFGRIEPELGADAPDGVNTNQRYVVGLSGKVDTWTWETYYQFGKNRYVGKVVENRLQARWTQSVDSVISPSTGQAICRSTLITPNDGCVPANVFGPGSISNAVKDWVTGDSYQDAKSSQSVFAANLNGTPLSLWAGPVSLATGVEYRKERLDGTADPQSQAFAWRQQNPQPVHGEFNVKEVYAETVVPIARDLPLINNLEVNGAIRYTDYSTSGGVTTWKIGLNYLPVSPIRVRLTRSRDIRAPNNNELFSSLVQNTGAATDPFLNQTVSIPSFTGGNPDLDPEVAQTFTGGVVYSPGWLRGVRGSVDVYSIKVKGAISNLGRQGTIDACFQGQTTTCAGIVRSPTTGSITQVFSRYFNLQSLASKGVDFEFSYQADLSDFSSNWSGRLRSRVLATYLDELSTVNSGVKIDTAGQVLGGGAPHWRGNFNTTYDNGPWLASLTAVYMGGGHWDNSYGPFDITDNSISSRPVFNISVQYTVLQGDGGRKIDLFGKIDNLFDRDPPLTPQNAINPAPTSSGYYDKLGQRFAIGLRFRL